MVMRRALTDREFEDYGAGDEGNPFAKAVDLFNAGGFDGGPGPDATAPAPNEFGVYPPGTSPAEQIGAVRGDPIPGNTDRPRDVFQPSEPRSLAPPPMEAQGGGGGNPANTISDIVSLLPQGVEAKGGGSVSAPMQPQSPADQSVSMRATPPANAAGGPARQPFTSPSAIYGSESSRGLTGRGQGLFGGGIGMPGGPSGAPDPTKMMLDIVKRLSGQ